MCTPSTVPSRGGYLAIRRKAVTLHRLCMVTACVLSAVFLVGYLAYHYVHGDTRCAGEGLGRVFYLTVLASHVLLSIAVVPGCLTARIPGEVADADPCRASAPGRDVR